LAKNPGKNVRDALLDSFNAWFDVQPSTLASIKDVIGCLHSASLVIDDIEDSSLTRRGRPCAHVAFGVPRALNAGNYAYFLALEKVLLLQNPSCVEVFTREMLNLHRGQGRDIVWRDTFRVVSEAEYRDMVVDKTGGWFLAPSSR
jgi:geranylgeranyl diphosphate synthase type 3